MTEASGPDPIDWLAGLLRGLHPLRYLLCLVGLVLTGLSAALAKAIFDLGPLELEGWGRQPIEYARALQDEVLGGSLGRIIARGGPLLALNAALWYLIGGWIARHELVARRRGRSDTADEVVEPGATAFLVARWQGLALSCPVILLLVVILLVPVLVAGWLNTSLDGFGALTVSLLLPILLVFDLFPLLVALGVVAWPLIPVATAAEGCDQYEAFSRSYSYSFQRPVRFHLLTAIALGLAGLPLGALYLSAEQMTAWEPAARHTVVLLVAALSVSIFWSLETLVYLHLRSVIDGVDAGEVALGAAVTEPPRRPAPQAKADKAPPPGDAGAAPRRGLLRGTILLLAAAVGSWCLTYWLFTRASRGATEWLGWGLTGTLIPPAPNVCYRAASVIAGLWGVAWLALPLLFAVPRLLSGRAPPEQTARE